MDVCANNGCKTTGGASSEHFKGLSLSDERPFYFLDGIPGKEPSRQWYVVGYVQGRGGNGYGYPGFYPKKTKLLVWKKDPVTTTPKPTTTTEAPTGRWIEVYSQDRDYVESTFRRCSLSSCNVKMDDFNFLNFDQVKGLSEYRMKFDWGSGGTLEWTQSSNPLSVQGRSQQLTVRVRYLLMGLNS